MRNLSALRLLVCSLIAAWLLPCATTYGQNKESDYLLGQGVHAYHSGKYAEAQRHLTAAIDGGSHDPRVYYFRGLCAAKLGRTADANADFLEGAKLEQTFVGRPGEVGRILQRVQGPTRLALEGYRSRARTAALQERGQNQPQVASQPAPARQAPAAAPRSPSPVQAAPAAPEVVKAPPPASPVKPVKPQIAAPVKPAPAAKDVVVSPKPAMIEKPSPRPTSAPAANVATAPSKAPVATVPTAPETAPTAKTSKLEQAPSGPALGFDFGKAMDGLTGGNLPGNMAYLRISKRYLDQLMGEEFHEQRPTSDWIMGTMYNGTSETRGRTQLVFIPNDRQAQIELRFKGSTNFCTSGRTGPVVMHSRGTTWFESCKLLSIDGRGANLTPASTCANTCYSTDNICTTLPRLMGRISLRIARRREAKGHDQASAIISQNSQRDIGHGFDVAMEQELAKVNNGIADQIKLLPKDHPFVAHGIHSHTSADAVYVVLLGPGADEQKFVAAPMLNKQSPDLELHLHSSLVFKALSDPNVRRMLEPLGKSLLGNQELPKTPAEKLPANGDKQFDLYWSSDRSWLTLIWNAPPAASAETLAPLGKKN